MNINHNIFVGLLLLFKTSDNNKLQQKKWTIRFCNNNYKMMIKHYKKAPRRILTKIKNKKKCLYKMLYEMILF